MKQLAAVGNFMHDTLKKKVLSGLVWRGLERFGTQGISFLVSIVLARLLSPADYGAISMLTVFIAVAAVFVNSGFSAALVQSKEVDDKDYSSVFYLSLSIACLLYGILYYTAPWIADFYNMPLLIGVLRVSALSLIFGAVNSMQLAVLSREMKFHLSFKVSLSTVLTTGIVGIALACSGYGIWSLVWSSLAGQLVSTVMYWVTVNWRPRLSFSWLALRRLFGFGSKFLGSGLLDTVFQNLYPLMLGKLFDASILGHYSRGRGFPALATDMVNGTIAGVMFPALASCQDDRQRMKSIVRRMITTTSFFVFPLMVGLAVIAKPLVLVLLTEKWLPCVPFLQLSCITFAFWPLHTANLQAINALGRSDIFLTLEIVKKILIVVMILITFRHGVMAMVIGQAILSFVSVIINAIPNRKLLGYPLNEQVKDMAPAFVLAIFMGALTWSLAWMAANRYMLLGSQILLGVVVYATGAVLLKLESAEYLRRTGYQAFSPRIKRFTERFSGGKRGSGRTSFKN